MKKIFENISFISKHLTSGTQLFQIDTILSKNEAILTDGYAGAQVLAASLDTLGGQSRKKREVGRVKRQTSQNATECNVRNLKLHL